jgi:hypothetical protein
MKIQMRSTRLKKAIRKPERLKKKKQERLEHSLQHLQKELIIGIQSRTHLLVPMKLSKETPRILKHTNSNMMMNQIQVRKPVSNNNWMRQRELQRP